MKEGFYAVRGKRLPLVFVTLVVTTLLILFWDKTFLVSLLPAQSRLFQVSPEILLGAPVVSSVASKPHLQLNKDVFTVSVQDELNEGKGKYADVLAPVNTAKSPSERSKTNRKSVEKETSTETIIEEIQHKPSPEEVKAKEKGKEVEDIISPGVSANTSSLVGTKDKNSETVTKNQVCNYAKGKWVSDDRLPLYSGFGCKQWLSGMWACRLTQRTDFAYEKLRWQPKYCKMETFEKSTFLARMQDKTVALIGDSLGRQQFQSLMCMLTGGEESPEVQNVGKEYGLVKARGAIRPDGWAYRFPSTNTTILYYWSASLTNLEPLNSTDPLTNYAMHLDRPPAFLERFIHKFNVLVLNTGHHWNRGKLQANRWVMHVGGIPNTNKNIADIFGAKNFTIHSIVNWVDSQLPKYPNLKAFYRTISPRHFVNGDWNTGGSCDNTAPHSEGKEILQDESSDLVAAKAVEGTHVRILDITAPSELRDEGHISRYTIKGTSVGQDCLHWCLPGVPDSWNELLFAQL